MSAVLGALLDERGHFSEFSIMSDNAIIIRSMMRTGRAVMAELCGIKRRQMLASGHELAR